MKTLSLTVIAGLACGHFFLATAQVIQAPQPVVITQPITAVLPTGPTLDVIPYVSADGHSIQMTIIPSVVEYLGNDASPFTGGINGAGLRPDQPPVPLPRVGVRQVVTSVNVWDGQTVVLGGLISDNVSTRRDKVPVLGDVPVLGRLFRSESSVKTKKNLLILVTPTIIDPAGKRVHDPNALPFDPATTAANSPARP